MSEQVYALQEAAWREGFDAATASSDEARATLREQIADLRRALVLARCGLAEGLEAVVRRGVHVRWDVLEQRLRTTHDAAHHALQPEKH